MKKVTELKENEEGIVLSIAGGVHLKQRLLNLGIMPDKKIKKISELFSRGPVTITIDSSKVAIGYGMAERIFVEEIKK